MNKKIDLSFGRWLVPGQGGSTHVAETLRGDVIEIVQNPANNRTDCEQNYWLSVELQELGTPHCWETSLLNRNCYESPLCSRALSGGS